MTTPNVSIADIISQMAPRKRENGSFVERWLDDLGDWLETKYEKLIHAERKPGLHASSLWKVCARKELLTHIFGDKKRPPKAGNQLTFDVGHALHFWWQHRYLGPKQELIGDWLCYACPCPECGGDQDKTSKCGSCRQTGRKLTYGKMPLNCECGAPWQDAIAYMELEVVDEELQYVGHADGIIDCKDNKRRVFEFKTIGPNGYPDLQAPKTAHIIQAHSYMKPLGLDEALIVYQDKGKQCDWMISGGAWSTGKMHIKPFIVKFDEEIWNPIEQRIREHHDARAFIQSLIDADKAPTPNDVAGLRRVCNTSRCALARDCPVRNQCFTMDAP